MKTVIGIILMGLFLSQTADAQETKAVNDNKIVVLGSSMAAGWVTSYEEKYDFKNGYAYRLQRYLADKGFTLLNKSVPGDDTKRALARFDEDVLSEMPEYLFIGLSMSNEGLETENPDSVMLWFETGIKKLIAKCENNGIKPILGSCYANNNFTPQQFDYLKKMNIRMNSWGYPMVNLLGAIDNGNGHFPEGLTFDPNHPMDRGHEEFFLAFTPDFFPAMDQGKIIPVSIPHESSIKLGTKAKTNKLHYYPESLMHSFSYGFDFRYNRPGQLAEIRTANDAVLLKTEANKLIYTGISGTIESMELTKKTWYHIMITHRYSDHSTLLYLNGELLGSLKEQLEPAAFILGGHQKYCEFRDLMIYRSALNPNELSQMQQQLFHASLDCYAPLNNGSLDNFALSNSRILADPSDEPALFNNSVANISKAALARANELKVKHKEPIHMDPKEYLKFAGKYEIAKDDFFVIEVKADKIYLVDRGQSTEILPEAPNKFYIHFPGELTITFDRDEQGKMILNANFNGYKMTAKKI
ncbi:MAG: hypothetical protein JEZ03_05080 [Bacteroidales bacterium]|nr:hypothetical protein [Bacteroidales bacterium]